MKDQNNYISNVGGVSQFSPERIKKEDLDKIMRSLSYAPSSANAQPWEVIVSESGDIRKKILQTLMDSQFRPLKTESLGGNHWLMKAPVVFILALDRMRAKAKYGGPEAEKFGWIDIGSTSQNFLVTALSLGIKGTIIREFDHKAVGKLFNLPEHIQPALIFGMGYSDDSALERPYLSTDDYVHYESWTGHLEERH
jgi:nitroreductase